MYLGFLSGSFTNLRTVGEEESHSFNSTLPIRMFWSVIPQIWNELWNLKVIWNCNYQKCDQQTNSKIARNKKSFLLTISLVDVNKLTDFSLHKNEVFLHSKCDQIRRKLRIWSHLPKKSLMKNYSFSAVCLILQFNFLIQTIPININNRGIFKTLPNTHDGAFCENNAWFNAINCFCKKAPSQIFDRILNITLTTARKVSVFGVFLEFVKIERVERFMGKQISLIFKSLVCCL